MDTWANIDGLRGYYSHSGHGPFEELQIAYMVVEEERLIKVKESL